MKMFLEPILIKNAKWILEMRLKLQEALLSVLGTLLNEPDSSVCWK